MPVFPRHRLQRTRLVSNPGMHHGTCITHVPWSLSRSGGEKVTGIPGACAIRSFTYLARGPSMSSLRCYDKTAYGVWVCCALFYFLLRVLNWLTYCMHIYWSHLGGRIRAYVSVLVALEMSYLNRQTWPSCSSLMVDTSAQGYNTWPDNTHPGEEVCVKSLVKEQAKLQYMHVIERLHRWSLGMDK